jgi:Co/Zn/Cd efflux system component
VWVKYRICWEASAAVRAACAQMVFRSCGVTRSPGGLAVLAEGGDYLLDAAGVGVAMLAISQSARSADRARPKRYPNATSIATLISSGWLLLLELLIAGGAADRLLNRTPARRSLVDLVGEQRCVKTGVTPAWRYQPGRRG